jgi:hypothetical protein
MRACFSALLLVAALAGCHRHPATPAECRTILDRIVELELRELGFRDPALQQRKIAAAEQLFAPDLVRCSGVRVRDSALSCVRIATSVEELSHRCLR